MCLNLVLLLDKAAGLLSCEVKSVEQDKQLQHPDARIVFEHIDPASLLSNYAECWQGLVSSDDNKFVCRFWEIANKNPL